MSRRGFTMERLESLWRPFSSLLFGLYLFFTVFPFFRIFSLAFQPKEGAQEGLLAFLYLPTFDNARSILTDVFYGLSLHNEVTEVYLAHSLFTSLIIVCGAAVLSIFIGAPVAYFFWKTSFVTIKKMIMILLALRSLSLFFVLFSLLFVFWYFHLFETYWGMILSYQLPLLPLVIFILLIYFRNIPPSIIESAEIDGAPLLSRALFLLLPMIKPGLLLSLALAFLVGWQQLTIPLLLGGESIKPLTVAIVEILKYGEVVGPMASASLFISLPVFIMIAGYMLWNFFKST